MLENLNAKNILEVLVFLYDSPNKQLSSDDWKILTKDISYYSNVMYELAANKFIKSSGGKKNTIYTWIGPIRPNIHMVNKIHEAAVERQRMFTRRFAKNRRVEKAIESNKPMKEEVSQELLVSKMREDFKNLKYKYENLFGLEISLTVEFKNQFKL